MSSTDTGRATYVLCWVSEDAPFSRQKILPAFRRFDNTHRGSVTKLLHVGDDMPQEMALVVRSVSFFAPTLKKLLEMYGQIKQIGNIQYFEGAVWNQRSNELVVKQLEAKFNGGRIFFYPRAKYNTVELVSNLWAATLEKPWLERRTPEFQRKFTEDKKKKEESRKRAALEAPADAPLEQRKKFEKEVVLDQEEEILEFLDDAGDDQLKESNGGYVENSFSKCSCGIPLVGNEELNLGSCTNCFMERNKEQSDGPVKDLALMNMNNEDPVIPQEGVSVLIKAPTATVTQDSTSQSKKSPSGNTKKATQCGKCNKKKPDDGNVFCKGCHTKFCSLRTKTSFVQH